jgi:hypothetical protein
MWHILLGTSTNYLDIVEADMDNMRFNFLSSSSASSEGIMSECQGLVNFGPGAVASVHAQGELVLWQGFPEAPYYMALQAVRTVGVPTAIRAMERFLAVSYGNGMVRFFNQENLELHAEADLHGRCINAMDYHAASGLLLTVGEDTVINILAIEDGMIVIRNSQSACTKLPTGGCFLRNDTPQVAVTAYDAAQVIIFS